MSCGIPGERCGIIPIGPSGWCQRHDPDPAIALQRSQQSSEAAIASRPGDDDAKLDRILARADLGTLEGLADLRRKMLPLQISAKRYQLTLTNISGLEANLREQDKKGPREPGGPQDVIMRYGRRHGRRAASELHLVDGEGPA